MKISRIPITFGFLCMLMLSFAFIKKADDNPFEKIVASLQHWTDSIPQEKIYLHMDKPYYALGDTIWFKGYVTIGSRHQLSALSGAVYVDLINERDSVLKALKLPVTSGMVMGDFVLIDDYKQGSYRIRAYTQWMRNAGSEYFFDRTFTVGDLMSQNLIAKADYQYKTIDGKQQLTALLNFTNDEGRALGERNLRYQVVINKKVVWAQNIKTDALGSASIKIENAGNANLNGAYIRATIAGDGKYSLVRDFLIKAGQAQADVQFFPEGGNLVNGIASKVGFKAVGVDGLGIAIKGKVFDEANTEVASFETLHAGMGNFLLKPQAGKTYLAKVALPNGDTLTVPLPKAVDEGYTLSVYQPGKDSVLVRIHASASMLSQPQSVNLIAQTGGENIFASTVKIGKAMTSVWMEKKNFPSGVAQFTLFNSSGEPLSERVAFIRSKDLMALDIKTAKAAYKSKEHVKIDLEAKDSKGKPTAANFSVTVIDEGKMPVEESRESTIFSNILLTSDLKGYIERPNYYFTKETDEVNRALDNLMLTQGYRRFAWKKLDSVAHAKPKFEVEGLGMKITGRVATLTNKLVPKADVTLVSVIAGVTKFTTTDSLGRFTFDGMFMTDSLKFTVQARGPKNTDKVKMLVNRQPPLEMAPNPNLPDVSTNINATLKEYIDNGKKLDDIYERSGQLDKVHRLREVRIKARKPVPPPYTNQGMFKIPEGLSDQTITIAPDDTIQTSLKDWLAHEVKFSLLKPYGSLVSYLWIKNANGPGYSPLQVILDGRKVDLDEAAEILDGYQIQPESIYKIEIVRSLGSMLSSMGGPGLLIMTKRGYVRKNYTPSVANITPKGFNKVREFYQPRYDKPGASKLPDLRTTIHWNPYLKTDTNGKTAFNFFNADGPGNYKVIVEGINAEGELGRQVYRYTVDAGQAEAAMPTFVKPDKSLAIITAPLDSFNRRLPAEKVYLHTDKPYYNIGDTLWFKSYLLNATGFTPSKLSGLLYVELDKDTAGMVRRVSIPLKDGLGSGQIPLLPAIFREGSYTLRAYTNWMQNFGNDYIFSQRIYIGTPSETTWLVRSTASVNRVDDKNQLQIEVKLNKPDKLASPIALKKVEVKIYDEWHYIYKQEMQTGIDGSIRLAQILKDKADATRVRVQITSLEKDTKGKVIQIPLSINREEKIDLQFLPEGGNLVAGLKSTVGFKALKEDGKATPVLGGIYDGKGNEVVGFTAIHDGMGSFEFTPKANEVYTAKILKPITKTINLPKIHTTGTVMHINNAEVNDKLTINLAGLDKLGTDTACFLVATTRGGISYSHQVDVKQPEIEIAKDMFPSGVTRFTLFKGNKPLNQRAVFIDHKDQLAIKITPNKAAYNKRDSVGLDIEVKDRSGIPVQGNFSLAVTDDSQVKADSVGDFNIATSLLLNSELKGTIENPGYYLNREDKQARQALDNLMLTQGWTGYDWKDVFAPVKKPIKFEVEKDFKITGQVTNISKKPVPNAQVIISSQKPSFISSAVTDSAGMYVFKNLPQVDSGSFFLQANNQRGKQRASGNISVDKFVPPPLPDIKLAALPWYINTDSAQLNYMLRRIEKAHEDDLKLTGNVLKEVKIKSTKKLKNSLTVWGADLTFDEQDIKESATMTLWELLQQKLPGIKVIERNFVPMLLLNNCRVNIVVDAPKAYLPVIMDANPTAQELIDELNEFKIATFKDMEVIFGTPPAIGARLRTAAAAEFALLSNMQRNYLFACAMTPSVIPTGITTVYIHTTSGTGWFRNWVPGSVTYRPLPVMYPQQFYSPKYNVPVPLASGADYRSTIFWEPNINTDQNGKARVSFYTSDINGNYTLKIAGTDASGGIGDALIKLNNQTRPLN